MNTDRLAEVTAMLVERDQEFRPFEVLKRPGTGEEEHVWAASDLADFLGYDNKAQFQKVINLAKIAAGKAEWPIKDHFIDGEIFDAPGELFITKIAATLIVFNADPNKDRVGLAQAYFALQCDKQQAENEKRVRTRFEVATENRKLSGAAKKSGVEDFQKFNGMGVSALYGGLTVRQIAVRKGLKPTDPHLDFAGSEELAANLFRITQTAASLRREGWIGEEAACETHAAIGLSVRETILRAGNQPPEDLPAAEQSIDKTATAVKRKLSEKPRAKGRSRSLPQD